MPIQGLLRQEKDLASLAKNRRVEIVVQRNQHKNLDHYQNSFIKMGKTEQQRDEEMNR